MVFRTDQVEDIEFLIREDMFDLNSDRTVDQADYRIWVKDLRQTWFGDANLDGEFNSGDLVAVFQAGEYEDVEEYNSGWATGDWNGDGVFDSSDLVVAFQDGGYEKGSSRRLRMYQSRRAYSSQRLACLR